MILLIDHYDSFTYNIYQAVARRTEVKVVRYDAITAQEVLELKPDAIILSPGPGHPDALPESIELIQAVYRSIPILGVCLGHQLLAAAFGGNVIQAPVIMHGKVSEIAHTGQDLFTSLPDPLPVMRYHSLMAEKTSLPDVFNVQATADDGTVMAIRHNRFPLFGVQFHPESIGTPDGDRLVQNFLDAVPKLKNSVQPTNA
ncbi:anthranilate synthase component II [Planococcus lenghuensis]|uniref:Aminodeoxychorismate/anthranilate synthase component II n=1 Tax=Planococcus lenghuensis TaxID=2213202 RepID=A0A1Q2L290_9BACL|nr:aminodeoxychorismate/anthranilate synthase component II [Planococcus lenghuensis]AQQ54002.1 aminodeoxychorismate/anthranilate synthase component II [Planococcus lenghuensis]